MKKIFLSVLIFSALNASAKTLKCEIKDRVRPPYWPKEQILIQLEQYVLSVDYIHKIRNSDGTFSEKIENLFGDSNRAGYPVTYCNPNGNEFVESTGKINLFSECLYGSPGDKLFFDARFSTQEDGNIDMTMIPIGSEPIERKIPVSSCL